VWSAPPRPQGIKVGKKRFAKEILECYWQKGEVDAEWQD
jgi:hypothetical protein